MTDPIARIAAALERLSPPVVEGDPMQGHWFVWSAQGLESVPPPRAAPLDLYAGVDPQKAALVENARRHAAGLPSTCPPCPGCLPG